MADDPISMDLVWTLVMSAEAAVDVVSTKHRSNCLGVWIQVHGVIRMLEYFS
jgi:hypothetical protein